MSDLQVQGNTRIVITKPYGITHALKKLVEENPYATMSDGKITLSQWQKTLETLDKIQEERLKNNQAPIFRGGNDKTSNGWKTSYIVYPDQNIEFTQEEMTSLYQSMGVQINEPEEVVVATPEDIAAAEEAAKQAQKPLSAPEQQPEEKQQGRYELSWSQIGEIGAKSGKNFVKNMFCDEDGFSWKRTGATLGTIAGLALAAPIAKKLGGGKKLVNNIARLSKGAGLGLSGYMTYNGGKNLIQGTKGYYDATTEEEAKARMEQAWDGGIEAGMAIPAFLTIRAGANKGQRMVENQGKPKGKPEAKPEAKPAESKPAAKPVEESKQTGKNAKNATVDYNKVVSTEKEVRPDGAVYEYQMNANGDILKSTRFDKDGKFIGESNSKFDANGKKVEHNYKGADGYENTELYNNGVVEKIETKGSLGNDYLTRVGDRIYEGIRIKPDGTQVKIRFNDKTYQTTELGPVGAPKAAAQSPKAESKPAETKQSADDVIVQPEPVVEGKIAASADDVIVQPEPVVESKIVKPESKNVVKDIQAKNLLDGDNAKIVAEALLKANPGKTPKLKAFFAELKKCKASGESAETIAANLQNSANGIKGLKVFANNGKLYIQANGQGPYNIPIKQANELPVVKDVTTNKKVDSEPVVLPEAEPLIDNKPIIGDATQDNLLWFGNMGPLVE